MRVGLNTLFLVPGKMGGSEIYVRGLIDGLAKIDEWTQYVIFANQENVGLWVGLPDNFSVKLCPVRGANKIHRTLYEQFRLNSYIEELEIPILHSLGSTAPPSRQGVCSIVSILDLIFLRFPREFGAIQQMVAARLVRQGARCADHIITISNYSKQDIQREFAIEDPQITVTLLGCRSLPEDTKEADEFFQKSHITKPYIYSVAASYYHKNLAGLLRSFRILRRKLSPDLTLVISGLEMAAHGEYMRLRSELGLEKSVIFTGWVPDAVLRALYVQAECFVFPSLYEGFGLPVLEAMMLGTPVVCSNATSLPEVAGDAAILFDPSQDQAMADAISRCLSDRSLRESMAVKGRDRAAQFTWERCARETLEVYKKYWSKIHKCRN